LQERVKAIEQQLRQNDVTSNHSSEEALDQLREIQSRVEESTGLGGYPQKEEFGEIFAQLEGTLARNRLINPNMRPVCRSFEHNTLY
jgi:hypothetical protein